MECVGCRKSDEGTRLTQDDEVVRLNKCPICFRWACDECAHRAMGRMFCSKKCADQFFFGDDDD